LPDRQGRDDGAVRLLGEVDPLMDPTIDAMLIVYAAALRRHQQHLEDACDRHAWHVLARHLIERAVWSANSTDEPVRDGRPLPWNPNVFNQNDR
jgi:hypothetical protein